MIVTVTNSQQPWPLWISVALNSYRPVFPILQIFAGVWDLDVLSS